MELTEEYLKAVDQKIADEVKKIRDRIWQEKTSKRQLRQLEHSKTQYSLMYAEMLEKYLNMTVHAYVAEDVYKEGFKEFTEKLQAVTKENLVLSKENYELQVTIKHLNNELKQAKRKPVKKVKKPVEKPE
jgi:hypothetical protein